MKNEDTAPPWGDSDDRLAERLRELGPDGFGPAPSQPGAGLVEDVGDVLGGRYRLIERVGSGGMGVVFRADQTVPLRRVVAVKVIKPGVDTREVVARFDAERQVLTRMDHPAIARVLDAGTTASGRPFFVMEFVPGVPLTIYAERENLGVRDRLELFLAVCEAVSHAHTKAVIHRDIKPSNVLSWTENAGAGSTPGATRRRVKVIDFGIAKALTGDSPDATASPATSAGTLLGTYDYMSPEQAAGEGDLDTRADVYSLGVLLYELLTGERPFDRPTGAPSQEQIRQSVIDREPPRPSERIAARLSAARLRSKSGNPTADADARAATRDAAMERVLRSELEWIPLKAMRKARDRRYASVDEFAADVRNYLDGRALIAGPESGTYRARKFVKRHRVPLTFAATVAFLVFAGAAGTGVGLLREQRQRAIAEDNARSAGENARRAEENAQRAERSADEARRAATESERQARVAQGTLDLFGDSIFKATRAGGGGRTDVTVREVADTLAGQLDAPNTGLEPEAELAARQVVASTYTGLARHDEAIRHSLAAVATARARFGPETGATAEALRQLALTYRSATRGPDALRAARESRDLAMKVLGPDSPQTAVCRNLYAVQVEETGDVATAEAEYRASIEVLKRSRELTDPTLNVATFNLSLLLASQGKHAEARRMLSAIIEASEKAKQPILGMYTRYETMANLAIVEGRPDEARPWIEKARTVRLRELEPADYTPSWNYRLVATYASTVGNFQAAEAIWREIVAWYDGRPPTIYQLSARGELAVALGQQGRYDEAIPMLASVVDIARQAAGPDHSEVQYGEAALGMLLIRAGRAAEAEALLRRALAASNPDVWSRRAAWAEVTRTLADALLAQGKAKEALDLLTEADAVVSRECPDPAIFLPRQLHAWRGVALSANGMHADAIALLRPAWDEFSAQMTAGHPMLRDLGLALAASLDATGDASGAASVRDAMRNAKPGMPIGPPASPASKPAR